MKLRFLTVLTTIGLLVGCECAEDMDEVSSSADVQAIEVVDDSQGSGSDSAFANVAETNVYFAFDSSELVPEARDALEKQAQWLKDHPEARAEIAGHCDARGSVAYNDRLGQRRADASLKYLRELGVKNDISTVSYGNRVTLVAGTSEEAYAQNRVTITTIRD
jgi:peptidoglycan-associated lipoprotein